MAERHTFPQSGDQDYSENFAQLVGHDTLTGYVGTGLGVTFNSSTEIAISTGVIYVKQSSATLSGGVSDGEDRLELGFPAQLPDDTLTVPDNDISHIVVEPNLGTDDNAQFNDYQNEGSIPSTAIKIAEVDTNGPDTIDEDFNRATKHTVSAVAFTEGPDDEFLADYDKSQDAVVVSDAENDVDLLRLNKNSAVDVLNGLNFPNITGTPTFADHDHSEGGMTDVPNTGLVNSSVTVTAGDGLQNGGSVSLGSSVTLNIEPADFAGTFLSDDGSDNLIVDIGEGLENDGADNIRVDEDYDFTFTSKLDFNAGLNIGGGDISVGGNPIAQAVVVSGSGSLSGGTLDVDTGVDSGTNDNATFYPAIGVDTDDSKISARIYDNSGTGTYHVEFIETETSVGTTSIDYDIIRVR